MLSSFPAMLSSDGFFGTPFPAFEGGFTPWYCQEPTFPFQQDEPVFGLDPTQEPVFSNSGSDNSNPIHISSNSGSNEENRKRSSSNSGSDDPPIVDERKRRRMISNRESARRSRMRKQKHLENLRNQVNRLKVGNRDIMNQLRLVTHHSQLLLRDNERLRSESVMLRQKLWDIRQVLLVRQLQQQLASSAWPCNNVTSINEQTPTTLVT